MLLYSDHKAECMWNKLVEPIYKRCWIRDFIWKLLESTTPIEAPMMKGSSGHNSVIINKVDGKILNGRLLGLASIKVMHLFGLELKKI